MNKHIAVMVTTLVFTLFPILSMGDTVIYTHCASGTTQKETICLEEGFSEDSTEFYLQQLQIISQRDQRFSGDDFRYVRRESFAKNGCGPASVHNALSVTLGIEDAEVSVRILKEIMNLLAYMHNPVEHGLNYDQIQNLLTADPDKYPALASLVGQAGRVSYVGTVTANKVMREVQKDSDDLFLMGRLSLNTDTDELVDLSDALCEAGYPDAVIAFCDVSAGGDESKTPFGLGDEGHFIALMVIAGEFRDNGTVYVLDSCPRALRGEKLNDIYLTRYYFANSNYKSGFRLTYNVTRIKSTVVMCTLNEKSLAELRTLQKSQSESKKAAKQLRSTRIRFASYIKTFGTGTLMLRIRYEK